MQITLNELAKHNTRQSCWIAINGVVFDVTGFLNDHPGGADVLLQSAGQDATEAFESIGHSKHAMKQLETMMIGLLEGNNGYWF
jgi:cytochrome-b5 reductase